MKSRRFIRSSSQLEETAAAYQVSIVVALSDLSTRPRPGWVQERTLVSSNPNIILGCATAALMACVEDPPRLDKH